MDISADPLGTPPRLHSASQPAKQAAPAKPRAVAKRVEKAQPDECARQILLPGDRATQTMQGQPSQAAKSSLFEPQ